MKSVDFDPNNPGQVGCILGEPNEVYHAHSAISHSKLSEFIRRPAYYKGKYLDKVIDVGSTDALRVGSAAHCLILEGKEEFLRQYVVQDEELGWRKAVDKMDACAKLNSYLNDPVSEEVLEEEVFPMRKDEILAYFDARPGRQTLTTKQAQEVAQAEISVNLNPLAVQLLSGGMSEVTFRSEVVPHLGYAVQCRPDKLNLEGCELTDGEPYCVDLKSIAQLPQWNSQFWKRGYHRAYPFYEKTMKLAVGHQISKRWFWVVFEKEYPFECFVYGPSPEVYLRGEAELNHAMPMLTNSLHHDDFRDEGHDRVNLAKIPDWMLEAPTKPGFWVEEFNHE